MSLFVIVILLGLLEGLTEFIPVSSTGHLILLGEALGFEGERAKIFDVFIQLGAILAVVYLYFPIFRGFFDFQSSNHSDDGVRGWQGISKLAVASLPALIVGFLTHRLIKEHLFNSTVVAVTLIFGGLVMIWVERRGVEPKIRSLSEISLRTALLAGVFQCASLCPGMSRSGSMIIGGMLLGMDRKTAAEFSFLVAVPVMCAAVGYDLLKGWKYLGADDVAPFALGFFVAMVSAVLAIKFFIEILKRYSLTPFAIYRILLGVVVLSLA